MMKKTIRQWTGRASAMMLVAAGLSLAGCAAPAHYQAAPASLVTPPVVASAKPDVAKCTFGDPMVQTSLYFGTDRKNGKPITEKEWQAFVDQVVTPRFKDGLTVVKGKGQWLNHAGEVTHEGSKVLILLRAADNKTGDNNVEEIRKLYNKQFEQESVMRVDNPACVSF